MGTLPKLVIEQFRRVLTTFDEIDLQLCTNHMIQAPIHVMQAAAAEDSVFAFVMFLEQQNIFLHA